MAQAPRRMAESILLQLLDAKDTPEKYKNLVRAIGVPMLEMVDDELDNPDRSTIGSRLGDLNYFFAKQIAFATAYAAACITKIDLREREDLTNMIVDIFKEELDGCNKQFLKIQEEGKAKSEKQAKLILKAFGVSDEQIEEAIQKRKGAI